MTDKLEPRLPNELAMEITENIIWIGTPKPDKLNDVFFQIDYNENYKSEHRAKMLAIAKTIVDSYNDIKSIRAENARLKEAIKLVLPSLFKDTSTHGKANYWTLREVLGGEV
jgi:hypothetical protein